MMRPAPVRALAVGAAMTAVVVALAITMFARRDASTYADYAGTPVVPPKPAADFVLRMGNGAEGHLLDRTAAVTFLFFGYTHCPDTCPLALASLGRAYRTLGPSAASRVRIVFVTVDPARDTPPVAAAFARNFDPHIVAFTGTQATLARVWGAYGVRVDPKLREVAHGDTIGAIDATGRAVLVYPPDTAANELAADMMRFAR